MASNITRLLPYRAEHPHSEINEYALEGVSGEAGSVVRITAANLTDDPVGYTTRNTANGGWTPRFQHASSLYPEVPLKVDFCTGVQHSGQALGILLRDVRETDENGEKLLFYPEKKEELQCVVSGEAVPIATQGRYLVNVRGLQGGVAPTVGDLAVMCDEGRLTGVPVATATPDQKLGAVGKFLATGIRESQQDTDAFAGAYALLKLEL